MAKIREFVFILCIQLRYSFVMVGEIVVMPNGGTISLGYTFSYKHHRKGYAFEALTALISLLHERYPEWDFISFIEPENEPSMALLKKTGIQGYGLTLLTRWCALSMSRNLTGCRESI